VGQFPFFLYLTLSLKSKNYSLKLFSLFSCGVGPCLVDYGGQVWLFRAIPKRHRITTDPEQNAIFFRIGHGVITHNYTKVRKTKIKIIVNRENRGVIG